MNPASSAEAQRELDDLSKLIGAFPRTECELGQAHEIDTEVPYQAWCKWCHEQGRDRAGTAQMFGRDLRAIGVAGNIQIKIDGGYLLGRGKAGIGGMRILLPRPFLSTAVATHSIGIEDRISQAFVRAIAMKQARQQQRWANEVKAAFPGR